MTEQKTPYYITTAISYPNGKPHIGHAYEAIAADAIARFHRLSGDDVRFQTGTDEHGLKMVQTARDKGVRVQDLCKEMSDQFQAMCDGLNISYDNFQRTTDPLHQLAAQALWKKMVAAGDIYPSTYEGWYSVRDEAFYEEKELVAAEDGTKHSPQGTPVEWTVEQTWFFRLSKYQERLEKLYNECPDFIQPEGRRNEVMRFVEGGLKDISVSRTSFDWGVPVPDSPGHVMYVWVDALANYISGLGFGSSDSALMERFWPSAPAGGGELPPVNALHLIGKDIVRFHAVYWPAFLMSANLPLPRQIFGHGFLLARDGEKMSKSAGNVVDPMALAQTYGVDALRYFLLRDVRFGQDGTFSAQAIVERCNAELANSFGNLAQRVLSMIAKNLDGELPELNCGNSDDFELINTVEQSLYYNGSHTFLAYYRGLDFQFALNHWMIAVNNCNQYVDIQAPWALRKTDFERMKEVLAALFVCIRNLALVIQPIIPASAKNLLDQLGIPQDERDFTVIPDSNQFTTTRWYNLLRASGHRIAPPTPIFPRLELPQQD